MPEEQACDMALVNARRDLYQLMSDISEATWAAGWMYTLEYILWKGIQDHFKTGMPMDEENQRLLDLSKKAGGWWAVVGGGKEIVPMDQWLQMYEEWEKEQ